MSLRLAVRLSVAQQRCLAAPIRLAVLTSPTTLVSVASIAAITVIAAALRWYRIDAQSLWYDEGISAHQLTRSFAEIVRASALDTHPPLYYWTLKAWGELCG